MPSPADAEGGSNELEKAHKDLLWWQLLSNKLQAWSCLKTEISAGDTSASSARFHLHICEKQFQFINCGRLLPGVWVGAGASGISCLCHWACGIIWRFSDFKKSLKTKPKKSRSTTCKRNLSGIFKSSSYHQQSNHHSHLSCAIPWAGCCDHWSVAGVGQGLLIPKELLLVRHSWASSSGPRAHSCAGRFHLYSWPDCQSCSLELMQVTLKAQSWGRGWAYPREQC